MSVRVAVTVLGCPRRKLGVRVILSLNRCFVINVSDIVQDNESVSVSYRSCRVRPSEVVMDKR